MTHRPLFGTDGIRAYIGEQCFTDNNLILLGHALAQWITEDYGHQQTIIIGNDTRTSASWIKHTLSAALVRNGHHIYDAGIITTPMLCKIVQSSPSFSCGIMVTASHNPAAYNGIKICDNKTGKIASAAQRKIERLMSCNVQPQPLSSHTLGISHHSPEISSKYSTLLTSLFPTQFLKGLVVVLDCANGATSMIAPSLFTLFGAQVYTYHNQLNGTSINENCGAVHPESLQKYVHDHNADIGFAFDGDGDRVIAISRDSSIRDGDDILSMLSQHPLYKNQTSIIGTHMSNHGLALWLEQQGKKLIRTDVGDTHVGQTLLENNLLLGGEQAGHIIMRDFLYTGDGIVTSLRLLEAMIVTNNMEFHSFTKLPQHLINIRLKNNTHPSIDQLARITQDYNHYVPDGRILLRASGTEPVIRIMVEDRDMQHARTIAQTLATECENI